MSEKLQLARYENNQVPTKPNFNDFLQKTLDIKDHLDKSADKSNSFLKRSKVNAKADKQLVPAKVSVTDRDLDKSEVSGKTPKEDNKKKRLNFFRAIFGKAKNQPDSVNSPKNEVP